MTPKPILFATLFMTLLAVPLAASPLEVDAFSDLPQARSATPPEPSVLDPRSLVPLQNEWTTEADPASYSGTALESQPFRYDQRPPVQIQLQQRPTGSPIYYLKDVRWKQFARPEGAASGRRALFTTVRIDPDRVKNVYYCLKPFAPKIIAGHTALYFEMEPGAFTTVTGRPASGFVVSYEAYLRAAQSYDLLGGQKGEFRATYVVSTWRDFLMRSIDFNNSEVRRWKLELTPQQKSDLVKVSIREAIADHSAERYNTLFQSCVTAALDLTNEVVPENQKVRKKWIFGLFQTPGYSIPILVDKALRLNGLIRTPCETFRAVPPDEDAPEMSAQQ